jgi:DNA-binding NarL/FixJ family response regulator
VRVIVADDSALLRQGVANLLAAMNVDVIGQASTAEEVERLVDVQVPDVVIADIRMPPTHTDEGIRLAVQLRARHPQLAVLILSTYAQADYAMRLFEAARAPAGIGYLTKDSINDVRTLRSALDRLSAGESVVEPRIVDLLIDRRRTTNYLDRLTEREREVLRLMAQGRSNQGISDDLFLSAKTVETHAAAVFRKLELHSAPDANRRVLAVLSYLRGAELPS